jgi:hypothetical protein
MDLHKLFPILIFLVVRASQVSAQSFTGKWLLQNQREMAAGFDFRPDSTFQFFYSYGASDRFATGTWKTRGDTLVLKSRKEAGKDFILTHQSKKGTTYILQIRDKNPLLIEGIRCFAFSEGKREIFQSDAKGEISIPWSRCDTLYLQHPFFPDIASLVKDKNNPNRTFECTLSPQLAEVSFKGILFWKENDGALHCHPNYFMPMENIRFEKRE